MTLLDECIEALGNNGEIVCDSEKKASPGVFHEILPDHEMGTYRLGECYASFFCNDLE